MAEIATSPSFVRRARFPGCGGDVVQERDYGVRIQEIAHQPKSFSGAALLRDRLFVDRSNEVVVEPADERIQPTPIFG